MKTMNAEAAKRELAGGHLLVETRHSEGQSFGLENGAAVPPKVARSLQGDMFVIAQDDGLFPGHSQTFKVIA
jgi:hypothetical protein